MSYNMRSDGVSEEEMSASKELLSRMVDVMNDGLPGTFGRTVNFLDKDSGIEFTAHINKLHMIDTINVCLN